MILKCLPVSALLLLVSALILFVRVECLFLEDSCTAENKPGVCKQLSDCDHLLDEIRRAGSPMPVYLRGKLQMLSCGFDSDEPLICCRTENVEGNAGIALNAGSTDSFNKPWETQSNGATNQYPSKDFNNNGDWSNNKNSNDNANRPSNSPRHPNLGILPANCGVIESDRIFGGNKTHLFEMPWMVLISYESARGTKLSCGGTLITEWYVLTAAHCVTFLGGRLVLSGVILGEHDIRQDPDCERNEDELNCAQPIRSVAIDTAIPHPGYSPQGLFDDIALVRLSEPADFTSYSMKPICLPITPELQTERLVGQRGVVAGWGITDNGLQSPVLLSVDLPILSNEECQAAFNGSPHIYEKQLCAGGVRDMDSCGGDSGGPLLVPGRPGAAGVRYVQRGIVSYGSKRCGVGGLPGVYTRVSSYMDWILDNIRR